MEVDATITYFYLETTQNNYLKPFKKRRENKYSKKI